MFLEKKKQLFNGRARLIVIALLLISLVGIAGAAGQTDVAKPLQFGTDSVEGKLVALKVDGVELEIATRAQNVASFIQEVGVYIGPHDMVKPSINTPINVVREVEVLRVEHQYITQTRELDLVTRYDSRLDIPVGIERVVEKGEAGLIEETIRIVIVNGEEANRVIAAEKVIREPKNKVIALGVQDMETKEGVTFSFTQFFDDAELTAYAAGFKHTNKNPGDYWYGMTFTGTEVADNRTVAVDPKVIPLGWWIYVEGYGFLRAEDTGSAVRNKRVDIYFSDEDYVDNFGLKRNAKVWIIGPQDPRENY